MEQYPPPPTHSTPGLDQCTGPACLPAPWSCPPEQAHQQWGLLCPSLSFWAPVVKRERRGSGREARIPPGHWGGEYLPGTPLSCSLSYAPPYPPAPSSTSLYPKLLPLTTRTFSADTFGAARRRNLPFQKRTFFLFPSERKGSGPNPLLHTRQRLPWCGCKMYLPSKGRTPIPVSDVSSLAIMFGNRHRERCRKLLTCVGRNASIAMSRMMR